MIPDPSLNLSQIKIASLNDKSQIPGELGHETDEEAQMSSKLEESHKRKRIRATAIEVQTFN